MAFSNIVSPVVLNKYIEFWLSEDIPNFDLSCLAVGSKRVCALIEIKEGGVLAGLPFAEAVFKYLDCVVAWRFTEGTMIEGRKIIAEVRGSSSKLMMAERTALNILSRASGVATIARRVHKIVSPKWCGDLSGTRKTSPGMRMVEKYAMYVGGICTHRYDLSSMVMLKDNHIKVNGSITESVKIVREKVGRMIMVEVECGTVEEALEASRANADVIMLDNFNSQDVQSISKQVKEANPSVLIEVSGGINENNILEYAITNVDIISSSMFCQGYKCIDVSMNVANNAKNILTENHEDVYDSGYALDIEVVDIDIFDKTDDFSIGDCEASISHVVTKASHPVVSSAAAVTPVDPKAILTKIAPVAPKVTVHAAPVAPKADVSVAPKAVIAPATSVAPKDIVAPITTVTSKDIAQSGTTISPKVGLKRKIDEAPEKTVNSKSNLTPIANSKSDTKKIEEKSPRITPKANSKTDNPPNKTQKLNNSSKSNTPYKHNNNSNKNASSNNAGHYSSMNTLGSARLPGHPLTILSATRGPNNAPMLRSMISGLGMFQNHQPNDAFFQGSSAIRYGGGGGGFGRTSMVSLTDQRGLQSQYGPPRTGGGTRFFCKGCNYQNPANGPPVCRLCRKMLA